LYGGLISGFQQVTVARSTLLMGSVQIGSSGVLNSLTLQGNLVPSSHTGRCIGGFFQAVGVF